MPQAGCWFMMIRRQMYPSSWKRACEGSNSGRHHKTLSIPHPKRSKHDPKHLYSNVFCSNTPGTNGKRQWEVRFVAVLCSEHRLLAKYLFSIPLPFPGFTWCLLAWAGENGGTETGAGFHPDMLKWPGDTNGRYVISLSIWSIFGINPEDLQNLAAKGNINSRILVWRHFFAIFKLNYLVWSCRNAVLITPSRPSFRHGLRPLWRRYHFSWRPNPISVSTWANDPCTCLTSSHCIHRWTSLNVVEHRWTKSTDYPGKRPHTVLQGTWRGDARSDFVSSPCEELCRRSCARSPWQVLCRSCCARSLCKAICTRCL